MAWRLRVSVVTFWIAGAAAFTIHIADSDCGGVSMNFAEFVERYGRSYQPASEEYSARLALFQQRTDAIRRQNCDPTMPWTSTVNHLTDWTPAELASLRGHKSMRRGNSPGSLQDRMPSFIASRGQQKEPLPRTFSWAELSEISAPSEDQGECGSCWAVASGVAMRARAEIKGLPHYFSTKQLTACTPNPHKCGGTGGCDGATAELAFEYVLRAGLVSSKQWRKKNGQNQTYCPENMRVASEVATQAVLAADGSEVHMLPKIASDLRGMSIGMRGWTKLPENKEEPMMRALMEGGPVYVAVATGDHWGFYNEGVMTEAGCHKDHVINHAVVLFAWGIKEKTKIGPVNYWHLKNSWGPNWGENGTVKLHRQDDEEARCGWDAKPQEGSGCEGGPEKVWVCGACGILYDAVVPHF